MSAIAARPELAPAAARAAEVERRVMRTVFQPPPRMTVTEWADSFRFLSPESSAEPGRYNSGRAPYQREPMNALSDPRVKRVILMFPSQVGKTEVMNCFIGKRIHLEPGPMLVLQPTLQMGEAWSKDRLAPMLRDTPVLRGKVKDARSRDADNTLLHKKFPGGHLTIAGANSPAGLASRPIRDILMDEIDRYPISAGSEGDPIGLATRRGATFRNGKHLYISTPTVKGASRIEAEFERSTREKWWVPCPHCGELQILEWGGRDTKHGIKWTPGEPESAFYCCKFCAGVVGEMWKTWMNERGRWIADNPGNPTRGFWTNALISPWAKWSDLVAEWLDVHHDSIRLRQFVNTVLCETWEDEGAELDKGKLTERLKSEHYHFGMVPAGVAVLTCGVDVQGDRLEASVWGWGAGEEGWLIDTAFIIGDPGTPEPWRELSDFLRGTWTHHTGAVLRLSATLVDSGGHHTKEVYSFTREHVGLHVFACKGSSVEGHPILGKPSRSNSARALLYMVGSFSGKESVMTRFAKIAEPGPGYLHLPTDIDPVTLEQYTNEKLITKIVGGRAKRIFKTTGRNEKLDELVYAMGALYTLGPVTVRSLGTIAAQMQAKAVARTTEPSEVERRNEHMARVLNVARKTKRRGGGWVNG